MLIGQRGLTRRQFAYATHMDLAHEAMIGER